jgi:hypothetical protein
MPKKSSNLVKSPKPKKISNREVQLLLIDNFVNLQKVLTNLTYKFDQLSSDISRLLGLYEISAKTFLKKLEEGNLTDEDKDVMKKLDTLIDQNKTVAKGLTLIEEKIRHKVYGDHIPSEAIRAFPNNVGQIGNTNNPNQIGEKPKPRPLPRI